MPFFIVACKILNKWITKHFILVILFLSNHHWFAVCSELLIEPPKYPAQSHRSNWILTNYIYINYISSLLDHLVCFDLMTGDHYYNIQIKQLSFFYMECYMECVSHEICRKNFIHNFFSNLHLHGQKKASTWRYFSTSPKCFGEKEKYRYRYHDRCVLTGCLTVNPLPENNWKTT